MLKTFLLASLLVSLALAPLYSDITLSESEYLELMTLIEDSEKELRNQEKELIRLDAIIKMQETILEEQRKYLETQRGEKILSTIRDLLTGAGIGLLLGEMN